MTSQSKKSKGTGYLGNTINNKKKGGGGGKKREKPGFLLSGDRRGAQARRIVLLRRVFCRLKKRGI